MDAQNAGFTPAEATPAPIAGTLSADDLARARDLVIKANPNVVPELVSGSSLAELEASAATAAAAYDRIRQQLQPATDASSATPPNATAAAATSAAPAATATPPAPVIPAGAAAAVVDPASLSGEALIRRGVAARRNGR